MLRQIALCLNWILAVSLGSFWYAQRPEKPTNTVPTPEQASTPTTPADVALQQKTPSVIIEALRARAEAYRKNTELSVASTPRSKEAGYASTNGLWVDALKDPAYHEKLNRWLKLTLTQNAIPMLRLLNLPDDKREALIDLLVNRSIEGIDVQELASDAPVTQRQMRHQVLDNHQSKIVELLGDKFWLYNQYVGLDMDGFRRHTLEPVANLLEIYGLPFSREQTVDLVDWFSSDEKRQRAPYESLATWAESNRSQLTAQQKQTLSPVLQELSALDPPKTKKKSAKAATP